MNNLWIHTGLFVLVSSVIVAISCMFADSDDRAALRSFPRRWLSFMGGCLLVVAVMLVLEHTFASIH
ncbi:MAG: hypothetical protein H6830_12105 [Planctomycetes bacterium]|nr:hypothetical protein [Planctomycetota bacterium]MCB9910823.1 hypothetical protein [Planctomycetota bacterium]MCB9912245.1 hypothetical protein [Planctomycetota bacterium]HPF13840.1 hypothetical protein [Planctomycetota bacterium]HRV80964.1 hypothetical protein [Planctomycetota bacterium]